MNRTYVIRIDGHLDAHWTPWLGDPTLSHQPDGTTTITVTVTDQTQLYGVLTTLRDLNAVLLALQLT
ncbi:hypothetical protein [Kribbella sp. NPDC051770]|uniref:hypothetical protein n=1 Tax=Kribbella sp. NPDC051770 TaxID=3155413 RepID=UPI0034181ABD